MYLYKNIIPRCAIYTYRETLDVLFNITKKGNIIYIPRVLDEYTIHNIDNTRSINVRINLTEYENVRQNVKTY